MGTETNSPAPVMLRFVYKDVLGMKLMGTEYQWTYLLEMAGRIG